ncbi:O-antigen ligase family protein [Capnocytophaga canimorsus]|uniref:O-antigen ligase family protein n=1 Tax=Capnocytophaga canimorsus TaxID=28188 RepID=UPI001BB422CB|nr:O-antigen ligase family protein [Capnocytophaga canimorsus]
MIFSIHKNGYIISIIAFLILVFGIPLFYKDFWNDNNVKDLFFQISAGYFLVSSSIWVFLNRTLLFNKLWIRNLMIIVASCILLLWTYKHKITFRFDIILVFLGILHFIIYRNIVKPNGIIVSFLIFILWKMIGILWTPELAYAWKISGFDITILIILTCISSFGLQISSKETNAFITISFKFFLGLLAVNLAIYYLYINFLNKPFFSFFTLNKQYLSYYEVIRWSVFKHPSLITWLLLLVGGLGFLVHKENKKLISLPEVILYAILLLFFIFILQARVTILGYFLSLSFFFWLYISKDWNFRNKAIAVIGIVFLGISSVAFLVKKTSYFSDPSRAYMYQKGFEKIKENPIFGNGTTTQALLLRDIGHPHLHNDFLATLVDLGIIGLFILLVWLFYIFYIGIYTQNIKMIYTICVFLLIMNTDTILFSDFGVIGGTILIPFLIYLFFIEKKSTEELP